MRLLHLARATVLLVSLGGCVSSDPVAYSDAPATQSMSIQPPQRSYLDAGPAPARPSAPSDLRDSGTSFAGRSDSFGSGILPSF